MRRIFAPLLFMALLASPAAAQTVVSLAATGTVQVPPDQMTASLTVQANAASAAAAQKQVNITMAKALTESRAAAQVTATTAGYNVQDTSAKQNGTQFQATQELDLTIPAAGGAAPDNFTALLGRLQGQGLLLNGLDGGLSAAGRAQAQNTAIAGAIHGVQDQAALVAKTLGQHAGIMKTLNVSLDNPGPMPMRMMAMASAAPPPQAAPGPVTVTASVSAEIALTP
jgi:uncharacterized protein YggE